MSDLFREVDDALREDRARALWTRYGRFFVGVAVVIVAVTAGIVYWQDQRTVRGEAVADRMTQAMALAGGEPAEAAQALAMLGEEADGGQASVAALLEAALVQEIGEAEAAANRLAGVATDAPAAAWRDLATVQAGLLALAGAGQAIDVTELAAGDGPWRYGAQELAALAALDAGEVERARDLFSTLADDAAAPPALRARAEEMVSALDD